MSDAVVFGEEALPRYMTLAELIASMTTDLRTMNYPLVMCSLLFLPSFCHPHDFLSCLVKIYRADTTEQTKMKVLVIIRCWLRESFAQVDFSDVVLAELSAFLSKSQSEDTEETPMLQAAIAKIRDQLDILIDERTLFGSALDIYSQQTEHWTLPVTSHRVSVGSSVVKIDEGSYMASEYSRSMRSDTLEPSDGRSHLTSVETSSHPCPSDIQWRDSRPRFSGDPSQHNHPSIIKTICYTDMYKMLTILEIEDGLLTLRPREFTNAAWTKAHLKTVHPDLGGAKHLYRYIASTNQKISWIAQEIIDYGTCYGPTADCIEYFIQVGHKCVKVHNMNTVFQIVAALGLPAIKHLKAAWNNVSKSKMEKYRTLQELCDPSNNFANYRKHFDSIREYSRIPSIQVVLKDVSLMEASHPWVVDNNIDLQKISSLFQLLHANIFSTKESLRCPYIIQIDSTDTSSESLTAMDILSAPRSFLYNCALLQNPLIFPVRKKSGYETMRSSIFTSYLTLAAPASPEETSIFSFFGKKSPNPQLFTLSARDDKLVELQQTIHSCTADLNKLWQNSKIVDDIESSRLVHRLMKAGLA